MIAPPGGLGVSRSLYARGVMGITALRRNSRKRGAGRFQMTLHPHPAEGEGIFKTALKKGEVLCAPPSSEEKHYMTG